MFLAWRGASDLRWETRARQAERAGAAVPARGKERPTSEIHVLLRSHTSHNFTLVHLTATVSTCIYNIDRVGGDLSLDSQALAYGKPLCSFQAGNSSHVK